MGIIVKSIGTNNRDFASVQAFIDWIPADLVADGNSYTGELYNDSEFNDANGKIFLAGKNTDPSHFITLRCGPGQSFSTHPNRDTNVLYYKQANGVAIRCSTNIHVINCTVPYTVIDGLQIMQTNTTGSAMAAKGTGIVVKNCILLGNPGNSVNNGAVQNVGVGVTLINSLVVSGANYSEPDYATVGTGIMAQGGSIINCTIVRPYPKTILGVSAIGITPYTGGTVVKNCAIFGFSGRESSPANFASSDYNATDWSQAPGGASGTHNLLSVVYPDQFVNPSNNFRLKPDSSLLNVGANLSSTYTNVDILGSTRPTNWDIGAFELPVPASNLFLSGPALGMKGAQSAAFVVTADGYIDNAINLTLTDNGAGGTFSSPTVQLVGKTPTVSFTYMPAITGDISIGLTNSAGLTNPTALTFKVSNPATKIAVTAPTGSPRANTASGNFLVAADGYMVQPVRVVPDDNGGGGAFNPTFVTLDNSNPTASFTYIGVSGGDKTISVSNNGGLTSDVRTITLKDPVVATPTPSTDTLLVKSIGTGKDFATIKAFTDFAALYDLTANKKTLVGEVYENLGVASTVSFLAKNATPEYQLIVQPVPGLSANVVNKDDPLDYGVEGIELSIGSSITFGRGVVMRDMKVNFTAGGGFAMAASGQAAYPSPILERCRVRVNGTGAGFYVGAGTSDGIVRDSLLILENGSTGQMLSVSSFVDLRRCTLVRRGNASGTLLALGTSQGTVAKNMVMDNVFINAGATGITGLERVLAGNVLNNITDTTPSTAVAGLNVVTQATKALVRSLNSDYRPVDLGGLIGKGSENAVDVPDIFGISRGGSPDVGCAQGNVVNILPKVAITLQDVNGQTVTLSGTTRYAPTSGTVTLVPDPVNPNGAFQVGPLPVTLTDGGFNAQLDGVPVGNYLPPVVTMVNPSGYNRLQTGGEAINILAVAGRIVGSEASPAVGNAPNADFGNPGFDNTTLTIGGNVDIQGDAAATLTAYIDFTDGRASLGPFTANILGKQWGAQFPNLTGKFKVRLVGVANKRNPATMVSNEFKVVDYKGKFKLPVV